MDRIEAIKAKIQQIETLCDEVLEELSALQKESKLEPRKTKRQDEKPPTESECREEYDQLYTAFLSGNVNAVEKFVENKSREYMKVFCKVNNILVDPMRVSRERVRNEIIQWFAQRRAISEGVSSRQPP